MNIKHNISLKHYNTFGIDVKAKHFIAVSNVEELIAALRLQDYPDKFMLGGGSNLLLTQDIDALVIHIHIKGREVVYEDEGVVHIKVAAGENWHEFVLWTLQNRWGGLENLSLIPGNAGAAPIQNIGAYGVELKDVFIACEALDIDTLELKDFTAEACKFGYRDSVFKTEARGKYIITGLSLKLTKKEHRLNTSYGSIREVLHEQGISTPTIKDISNAVIAIRKSKLPDPEEIGNSGSFFKNPVISAAHFKTIKTRHPEAPSYPVPGQPGQIKVPAGWLIEQCGFKGKRKGDAGVHKNQALVLVNYGKASGGDILKLARSIQAAVKDRFGIVLESEVNII